MAVWNVVWGWEEKHTVTYKKTQKNAETLFNMDFIEVFSTTWTSRSLSTTAADAYYQLHATTWSSQPQEQSATALVASPLQDQLRVARCRHHSAMTNCLSLHSSSTQDWTFCQSIRLFSSTLVTVVNCKSEWANITLTTTTTNTTTISVLRGVFLSQSLDQYLQLNQNSYHTWTYNRILNTIRYYYNERRYLINTVKKILGQTENHVPRPVYPKDIPTLHCRYTRKGSPIPVSPLKALWCTSRWVTKTHVGHPTQVPPVNG